MGGIVKSYRENQAMVNGIRYCPYSTGFFHTSLGPPRLLFILTISFENGEEMQVLSDQTWTGRQGPILYDSVYNGELYDARYDRPNWARVGFNDSLSAWIMPELMPPPVNVTLNGQLILQDMLPIRAGLDALHFETNEENGYLKTDDIGKIKGAPLTDGGSGVLKPVAMWQPTVGRSYSLLKRHTR
jgi:hypothetical protein